MDQQDHSAGFTRREVIQLLGGAAGLGVLAGCGDFGDPASRPPGPDSKPP